MNTKQPWNRLTPTHIKPKVQPMRKVSRFRRAPEIPEGMVYILDVCQHEVPKPTPDTLDIRCPYCPGE